MEDTPVAVLQDGEVYYVDSDQIGAPRTLTDRHRHVVWRWDGRPFGDSRPASTPSHEHTNIAYHLRFPGQYFDTEIGLNYNLTRTYKPGTGRYMQPDPIGLNGGLNAYSYVENMPLMFSDPSGLKTYQCKKPLHAFGGEGTRSGPDIWGNPFYHQYSCVIDNNGKITCGGQDRTGSGAGSPGKPSDDSYESNTCKQTQDDNTCFESCLIKEWKKKRPWYGIPFGTDCQEYDDDVNEKCRKQCNL